MDDTLLKIEVNNMQESIKRLIKEHGIHIVTLGNFITEALTEAGKPSTFKLLSIEEAKKWKEELN